MKSKRVELVAAAIAAMMFSYFVGYYDGAYTKHRTHTTETALLRR